MNPQRAVAKQLSKSRNPRDRQIARQLARGRVSPGSALDYAIRLSAGVIKDAGGGDGGVAGPMTGDQTYTPNAGSGFKSKKTRIILDGNDID